ncbi:MULTISPECIES: hypothetical protein [Bacillus cereus group]|uniref:hypothetical protein n=1 Tax=Bacillus cereus group TaxID=86661 RepID=UPI000BF799C2|nr:MULTISPECIES: hypothetical protein [Bacillus cereus group]PGA25404.1 hypothetical protein COL80_16130 [Bacillus thuringiensis]PGU82176.1 hypothetical protein COD76_11865 [Bacillus cereus]
MREILNLQALKHSKNRKHNKIYKKAHRIMSEGYETPELTDDEVMNIAKGFKMLDITVLINGDIRVISKKDTWMIRDEGRFYTLYHRGFTFTKERMKESYHIQDVFYDINYIFASIVSHDDYALGIKCRKHSDLLEIVESCRF